MRWVVVLLVSACYHPASVAPCTATCDMATPCPDGLTCNAGGYCANTGATCGPDGEIDAMPDAPPCPGTLVGKQLLQVCLQPNLSMSRMLTGTIRTDTDLRCNEFVVDPKAGLCTIAGTQIAVTDVVASGSIPLVLAAEGTIQITSSTGTSGAGLDVSSRGSNAGAGGNASECDVSTINGNSNGSGAGGSFQGRGGEGAAVLVMNAGVPAPALPPGVHGGCPGGHGGVPGGAGGGAIYFAAQSLIVNGNILAFGGGGAGGPTSTGAGGGGSGGFIGLDADSVSIGNGFAIVASGGGGGGGGGDGGNASGTGGGDPAMPNWVGIFGSGGNGTNGVGGNGGTGSPGDTAYAGDHGNQGSTGPSGSGGGGGGAGYVLARPTGLTRGTSVTITPAPTIQ
jgi:hypothetical protein